MGSAHADAEVLSARVAREKWPVHTEVNLEERILQYLGKMTVNISEEKIDRLVGNKFSPARNDGDAFPALA